MCQECTRQSRLQSAWEIWIFSSVSSSVSCFADNEREALDLLRLQTYQVHWHQLQREMWRETSSSNFLLHILVFCFQRFNYLIIETTWVWIHRRPPLLALIFLATHLAVQNWSHFPPSLGNLFYVTPQHSLLGYLFKGNCARWFHKEFPAVMHSVARLHIYDFVPAANFPAACFPAITAYKSAGEAISSGLRKKGGNPH